MPLPIPHIPDAITPVSVPKFYVRPVQPHLAAGNGMIVPTHNRLRELANQIKAHRGKELFASDGRCGNPAFANGTSAARDRWRFYCRTGPFTSSVTVVFVQARQNEGSKTPPWEIEPARSILTLFDSGGGVFSATYYYGATNHEPAGTPNENGIGRFVITGLSPNTEYHGLFQDAGYGVLAAAVVYENPTLDTYLPLLSPGAPITQELRQQLVDFVNAATRGWGGQLYNKSQDFQSTPAVFGSGSAVNIWDGSTTTTVNDAGITLDLTGKARSVAAGVPVKLWARLGRTTGSNTTTITVKATGGTVLGTLAATTNTTPAWFSTTLTLPASASRCSIHLAHTGTGSSNLYALSMYEDVF